jgi:hypothetical protein
VKQEPISKGVAALLDGLDSDKGATTTVSDDPLNQDGVVVKVGSKIEVEGNNSDIESTLTVGASDEGNDGVATFSANDEINEGKATFGSSGENSPVEVIEASAAVIVESDDGIDVQSLLDTL